MQNKACECILKILSEVHKYLNFEMVWISDLAEPSVSHKEIQKQALTTLFLFFRC